MNEATTLGPYAAFILTAYAAAIAIVAGLVAWVMLDRRHLIRLIAEVEAITRAGLIARETGCALHIVHISSGKGVAAALEARSLGANVSIETCPHYLFFTEDDVLRIGAVAKCTPPLRSGAEIFVIPAISGGANELQTGLG